MPVLRFNIFVKFSALRVKKAQMEPSWSEERRNISMDKT
jgi:hypothetical protein